MAEIVAIKHCLQRQRQLLHSLLIETDMILAKIDPQRQEDEQEKQERVEAKLEAKWQCQQEPSSCAHVKKTLVTISSGPRDNGEYTYRCCQCGLIL